MAGSSSHVALSFGVRLVGHSNSHTISFLAVSSVTSCGTPNPPGLLRRRAESGLSSGLGKIALSELVANRIPACFGIDCEANQQSTMINDQRVEAPTSRN